MVAEVAGPLRAGRNRVQFSCALALIAGSDCGLLVGIAAVWHCRSLALLYREQVTVGEMGTCLVGMLQSKRVRATRGNSSAEQLEVWVCKLWRSVFSGLSERRELTHNAS